MRSEMDSGASVLNELFPAVTQCLFVTLVGYMAGRLSILSATHMRGIEKFVGQFSLPSLVFLSLATIKFNSVNWYFLYAVLLTKTLVFALVFIASFLLSKPRNLSAAALCAIFCTQSNDFAIGYSILSSIYTRSHPEFVSYLYLVTPVSLCFLNPIGFFCMELSRQRLQASSSSGGSAGGVASTLRCLVLSARGVATNPIVVMTVAGVVANLALNHNVPRVVHAMFGTFGDAFSATALFMLGLRLAYPVGDNVNATSCTSSSPTPYLVSVCLIVVKSLVTPLMARQIMSLLVGSESPQAVDLTNFAFLYGLLPTAPSVLVYSSQYNVMVRTVSQALVMGTFLAAPLIFVSVWVVSVYSTVLPSDYVAFLKVYLFDMSVLGLVCGLWVLALFILSGKFRRPPHSYTFGLVLSQILVCVGGVIITSVASSNRALFFVRFLPCLAGVLSARVWTAMLAVCLVMLRRGSPGNTVRYRMITITVGWVFPILLTATLLAVNNSRFLYEGDPNFILGLYQSVPATAVLTLCLLITLASISIHFRSSDVPFNLPSPDPGSQGSSSPSAQTSDSEEPGERHDLLGAGVDPHQWMEGGAEPLSHQVRVDRMLQINRHIVLLLFLSVSMLVGLALSVWNIFTNTMTGAYAVVDFIDGALNFGQGFFVFVLFGVDDELLVAPVARLWRRLMVGTFSARLPELSQLSDETRRVCRQFCLHHAPQCRQHLAGTDWRGRCTFSGRQLVSWLVDVGLAENRGQAVEYGRRLVEGRVLQHNRHQQHFEDSPVMYQFIDTDASLDTRNRSTNGNS